MITTLKSCERTARKRHVCSFCGAYIVPGEKYDCSTHVYDGTIYDWKSHKECSFICGEIWKYVDPDNGMTGEEFCQAAQELCRFFICPKCENWDIEPEECVLDAGYCLDKLYETLKKNKLRYTRSKYGHVGFSLIPRKE